MGVKRTLVVHYDPSGKSQVGPLTQYDYGRRLRFEGFGDLLPETYEVHFSNNRDSGKAYTMVGNADGVEIPNAMLTKGLNIFAWLYLHEGEEDGQTVYAIHILVNRRSEINSAPPPPEQQDALTEALAALKAATDKAAETEQRMEASHILEFMQALENGEVSFDDGEAMDIADPEQVPDEPVDPASDPDFLAFLYALTHGQATFDDGEAVDIEGDDGDG